MELQGNGKRNCEYIFKNLIFYPNKVLEQKITRLPEYTIPDPKEIEPEHYALINTTQGTLPNAVQAQFERNTQKKLQKFPHIQKSSGLIS